MKKNFKTILVALFIMLPSIISAQTNIDTSKVISCALNSDFIFEGEIIETCSYVSDDGKAHTNNIIQIYKIGKGNLNCGTVSLITDGANFGDKEVTVSHGTRFNVGFTGIFFCKRNEMYMEPSTRCNISTTNNESITTYLSENSYFGYYPDQVNSIVEGLNSEFSTIDEIYLFIQNNSPFGLLDCSGSFAKLNKLKQFEVQSAQKSIPLHKTKKIRKKTRSTDLGYEFANFQITGDSIKYFEFDVEINSSSSGVYLYESAIRLKYNPQAFDTNIASKTVVSLATNFPATTYNYVQKINKTDSVLSIWIHPALNGQPKTNIGVFFQKLYHVKIPYKNCSHYPNIYMDTFSSIINYSEYVIGANINSSAPFDFVFADDTLIGELCYPEITSVKSVRTGNNITSAGTGDTILVRGKHFGTYSDSAGLYIPNADDGGETRFPIQHFDLTTKGWTDTLIRFVLYSDFDSTDKNFLDSVFNYTKGTPGSGNITVKNNWQLSDTTTTINNFLNIKYGLINSTISDTSKTPDIYYKTNNYLCGFQSSQKYVFKYYTNVIKDSMKWCIQSAMNRWKCLTGVNFEIDTISTTDSTVDLDLNNTICLTKFDSSSSDIIVATRSSYNNNPDSLMKKPIMGIMSIDFEINKDLIYWYDTTGTQSRPPNTVDFFVTMIHEFGHALQLIHVTDSSDFMYYAEFDESVTLSPANRRLNFNSYHKKGGDTTVYYSSNQSLLNYSGLALLPLIKLDTCGVRPLKIHNINATIDFNIYPNPVSSELNIELPNYGLKTITIYTFDGKLIDRFETKNSLHRVNVSNYSKGIYLIKVSQNNCSSIKKVICE